MPVDGTEFLHQYMKPVKKEKREERRGGERRGEDGERRGGEGRIAYSVAK